MPPQQTDTDRFHGIDGSYTTRRVQSALCDGRLISNDAVLFCLLHEKLGLVRGIPPSHNPGLGDFSILEASVNNLIAYSIVNVTGILTVGIFGLFFGRAYLSS